MVSTDDREIAALGEKYGAAVPFFRSAAASDDQATTAQVVDEVLAEYKKKGKEFDYCCCLYPTAPFVTAGQLQEAKKKIVESKAAAIFPVVRFSFPIQRALKIEDGFVSMIWPENMTRRSQDLMPAYHDAGQFYFLRVASFLEQKTMYATPSVAVVKDEMEVQDIDNETDWRVAELKYSIIQGLTK